MGYARSVVVSAIKAELVKVNRKFKTYEEQKRRVDEKDIRKALVEYKSLLQRVNADYSAQTGTPLSSLEDVEKIAEREGLDACLRLLEEQLVMVEKTVTLGATDEIEMVSIPSANPAVNLRTSPREKKQFGGSFKDQQVDLERGEVPLQGVEVELSSIALVDAAEGGDANKVQELLAAGADVNYSKVKKNGCTPLYIAAQNGHLDVVQALVDARADVNKAMAVDGCTPLYVAAFNGHLDVVQALVAGKANVNKAKTDGWTPLRVANHYNHTSIVACLKSAAATNNSALVDAAERGDTNKVGELLAAGADVNYSKEGNEGRTALYKAALNGHLDVVQALVAAEADVNKAKTDGWTPLRVANHFNHTSIAACLKSAGADE
ncbi:hypothetical protein TrST_g9899 [Triparma strigata]|uniref:Uncharacterized protein n=1 Tax=Triparma strigata TaxID=1606541 RepID=A0A9W7A2N5_9STRA|nr:hypothetical protein TrST_g9899 [Triparma strigata]